MVDTHPDKPPGPMGFAQRLRVHIKSPAISKADLDDSPLSYLETQDDGSMICEWETRSMSRGDDETLVYELDHLLWHHFGIDRGWQINWSQSTY